MIQIFSRLKELIRKYWKAEVPIEIMICGNRSLVWLNGEFFLNVDLKNDKLKIRVSRSVCDRYLDYSSDFFHFCFEWLAEFTEPKSYRESDNYYYCTVRLRDK